MNYSIYVGFDGVETELNVSICNKREFVYVYVRRHLEPAISTIFGVKCWGLGDVGYSLQKGSGSLSYTSIMSS